MKTRIKGIGNEKKIKTPILFALAVFAIISFTTTALGVGLVIDNATKSTIVGQNAIYFLTLNPGNITDTFNYTIQNPQNATMSLHVFDICLCPELDVTSTVPGTYVVNVTATSVLDPNINATVTTTTTVLPIVNGVSIAVDNPSKLTLSNTNTTYVLTINNTGNSFDTFNLIFSNPQNAMVVGLSPSFIRLPPIGILIGDVNNVNTHSIGTILLDVTNATPGSFIVNVTATSATNASANATVTTTTMVLPTFSIVNGVSIVADNSTQSTRIHGNVTYFLTVTNLENITDTFNLAVQNPQNTTIADLNIPNITLNANASGTVVLNVANVTLGSIVVNVTATSATNPSINGTAMTSTSGFAVTPNFLNIIDISDVLFLAQLLAGLRTPNASQIIAGDINGNGVLDVGDVLFLAQAVAGLRTL